MLQMMQRESASAQKRVDVGEERLILVQRNEIDFDVDNQRRFQTFERALKDQDLGPLYVHFEKINIRRFRNVVEAHGENLMRPDDLEAFGEMFEILRHSEIGFEQR